MPGDREWRGVAMELRRAATPRGRAALGCFSIEGLRLHERALRAGVAVEQALVAKSFLRDGKKRATDVLEGLAAGACRIHEAPDAAVDELTEGRSNGAIVGLVRLPAPPRLADLFRRAQSGPTLVLVALGVEDPGNVGALIRTALASGATALAAVGITDPYHPKAVRTSMGSLFKLPLLIYPEAGPLLEELATLEILRVGAVSAEGASLPTAGLGRVPTALFLGSEAFGLGAEVVAAMDRLVTIPMASGVDSFSVNAAAAVLLYEARRGASDAI